MEKRIIKSFEDLECWKAARVHFVNVKVNVNESGEQWAWPEDYGGRTEDLYRRTEVGGPRTKDLGLSPETSDPSPEATAHG